MSASEASASATAAALAPASSVPDQSVSAASATTLSPPVPGATAPAATAPAASATTAPPPVPGATAPSAPTAPASADTVPHQKKRRRNRNKGRANKPPSNANNASAAAATSASVAQPKSTLTSEEAEAKKLKNAKTRLSKSLSWILRHGLVKEGIPVRADGFVELSVILAHNRFKGVTLEQIQHVVERCPKQRYKLVVQMPSDSSDNSVTDITDGAIAHDTDPNIDISTHPTATDNTNDINSNNSSNNNNNNNSSKTIWLIRANQGHSHAVAAHISEDQLLTRVTDASQVLLCVHGTSLSAWTTGILPSKGLSRMRRSHVHFASGLPGEDGVMSGMRNSSQVLVYLNVAKALAQGVPLFQSSNGVVLSAGVDDTGVVPIECFERVENRQNGTLLWPVASK